MVFKGKTYSDEQLQWLLEAVEDVLTVGEHDICNANEKLLNTALRIGVVSEDDCNLG